MEWVFEGLFKGERRCYRAFIVFNTMQHAVCHISGVPSGNSETFTCLELNLYGTSGSARVSMILLSQKLNCQSLLHMSRPNLGIGLGLVERLHLSAAFSELRSLTLLFMTFQDPYSL